VCDKIELEIGEKIATFAEAKAKRGGAKKEKRTEDDKYLQGIYI
jgi:hypothetical protein